VHHATEELLLVLDGQPTLRSPDGERELSRGEVVHFPIGADGAHQVLNRSGALVRYLMVAAHSGIDAVEYVDERRVAVYSLSSSLLQEGGLHLSHDLPPD
jgi:uncharacterized cupin superfamily protein